MNSIKLGATDLSISRLAYGCWRIAPTEKFARNEGRAALLAAFEAGYTLFDHADIYGAGRAEEAFGRVADEIAEFKNTALVATKCGVCRPDDPPGAPYRYDNSQDHILRSCEASLKRLRIDTIDLYQLHRCDWLASFDEIAEAFSELQTSGKVRHFGLSNFSPAQVAAIQRVCPLPIESIQLEISLASRAPFIDGSLDACQAEHRTPLAWSPLAGGLLAAGARRLLPQQEAYQTDSVVTTADRIAERMGTGRAELGLAWLLRHPAKIVPIVGSVQPARIRSAVAATDLTLSREDWYHLLEAAEGQRLP